MHYALFAFLSYMGLMFGLAIGTPEFKETTNILWVYEVYLASAIISMWLSIKTQRFYMNEPVLFQTRYETLIGLLVWGALVWGLHQGTLPSPEQIPNAFPAIARVQMDAVVVYSLILWGFSKD